jgi:tripartite-type tricarboxylate transporter receptor subunit TctC
MVRVPRCKIFRTIQHCFAAALLVCGASALAQGFPAKPLRLVVSQGPGGTPDIMARLVAERLGNALEQPVIVENRPGASNGVALAIVGKSAPDGYTLVYTTFSAFSVNPFTFRNLPYDAEKGFAYVALAGNSPFFFLAHPGTPYRSLGELLSSEAAKSGKLSVATGPPMSFPALFVSWLNKLAGTKLVGVPYNVMTQGMQDTVAGRVELAVLTPPTAGPFIQRNALRPLATTAARSLPGFESVPPVAQTFPGFELIGRFVIAVPVATPPDRVQRLNRATNQVLKEEALSRRMRDAGVFADATETPEQIADYVREERATLGKLLRELGVEPE